MADGFPWMDSAELSPSDMLSEHKADPTSGLMCHSCITKQGNNTNLFSYLKVSSSYEEVQYTKQSGNSN